MPGNDKHPVQTLSTILVFTCLICSLAAQVQAEEPSLDSSWQLSSSQQEDAERIDGFTQRYGVGFNRQVTHAISFDLNMNYSRNVTNGYADSPDSDDASLYDTPSTTSERITETISPTGSLRLENDLFMSEFSGFMNKTNNSQLANQTNSNWEGLLASNWDYLYWPNLRFNLGRNFLYDDEQVPLTDSERFWTDLVAEWELDALSTYYSYYTQVRDDFVEQSSYNERRHFGRLDYTDSFFTGKVGLSLSGQLTESTVDITAVSSDTDEFDIKVQLSQGLSGRDQTPNTGRLENNATLIDSNFKNAAYTISPRDYGNLGVKPNFQTVDTLYVYTGQLEPLIQAETGAVGWDLYSSDDGLNWQLEKTNAATSYDSNRFRYQVDAGSLKKIYLKLVLTSWPAAARIPVTEIEAVRNEQGSGGRFNDTEEFTRSLGEINLRYNPTKRSRLSYSLVFDEQENNTGNDRNRLFQSAGLRYKFSKYFIPSITANLTDTTNSDVADTSQASYGLNVQSYLLPTLEANLGLTRNENFEDDEKLSASNNISAYLTAEIYPNMDSTLDINFNFNENYESQTSSENLGLLWTVTTRPRPSLLVDLVVEHGSNALNFDEVIDSPESGGQVTLSTNWRPSEQFSLIVNGNTGYGEAGEGLDSVLTNANLSLIRTSKTQLILGHRLSLDEEETSNNFNTNWNWKLSQYISMQALGFYLIGEEENSWFLNFRLTVGF